MNSFFIGTSEGRSGRDAKLKVGQLWNIVVAIPLFIYRFLRAFSSETGENFQTAGVKDTSKRFDRILKTISSKIRNNKEVNFKCPEK